MKFFQDLIFNMLSRIKNIRKDLPRWKKKSLWQLLQSELMIPRQRGTFKVSRNEMEDFALLANQGLDLKIVIELVFKEHDSIITQLKGGQKLSDILTKDNKDPYFQTLRVLMEHLSVKEAIQTCDFVHQSFVSIWKDSIGELLYPFLLFLFSFVMILFFDDYILPQMSSYTGTLHNPIITLLKILYFLVFIILFLGAGIYVYIRTGSYEKKHAWIQKMSKLHIFQRILSLQFSRILQSLLNKGISTQECFEIMSFMKFNTLIYTCSEYILSFLQKGMTLENAFMSCAYFDPVFIRLCKLGLYSASLERILDVYNLTTMKKVKDTIHRFCIWVQAFSYAGVGAVVIVVYQVLLMPLEMLKTI